MKAPFGWPERASYLIAGTPGGCLGSALVVADDLVLARLEGRVASAAADAAGAADAAQLNTIDTPNSMNERCMK
jgi:hypothetical protein